MIVREAQEESRIKQEAVAFQKKLAREKKHEASVSVLRRFSSKADVDGDWFWAVTSYVYFACRTLALFLLIDMVFFRRPNITLFAAIFGACYYFNKIAYKKISSLVRGRIKVNLFSSRKRPAADRQNAHLGLKREISGVYDKGS